VRYLPYIALSLIGVGLMAVGALSWGIPTAYGGMALVNIGFAFGYAQHLRREDPPAR
jgi:hypothetical protein